LAELKINMQPKRSIKLGILTNEMRPRLKQGLAKAGSILERQVKEHLSGPGFTRNPARSKPYPGVLHGTLRSSVHFRLESDGLTVHVGPGGAASAYAAIHEFGGYAGRHHKTYIPARPYVQPAWQKKGDEAIEAIRKAIMRGI
jgi:hypothetical protein